MIEKQKTESYKKNVAEFPLGKKEGLRIVFMGTPEFAVTSLDKLLQNGYNIAGVVTAPDKPGGRGLEMQKSAVKIFSEEKGLNILQPEKLKNPEFLAQLKSLKADIQVIVAFRMLPEVVWSMPPLGTINVHGSLLPQYRGAAPINWAIINGEKHTGVTTFKLQQEIDTGHILLAEKIMIRDDETAGELHDKMQEAGAELLLKTLEGLADGSLHELPQVSTINFQLSTSLHAPKIFTETCHIDFTKPVDEVYNLIRGLSPYPAAFTFLHEKKLKLFKVIKVIKIPGVAPGEFETDGKTFLQFACRNGFISITELQLEGKKKMNIADFLRGYRFP